MDYEKARDKIEEIIEEKVSLRGDLLCRKDQEVLPAHLEFRQQDLRFQVEALQTALHAIEFRLSFARKLKGIERIVAVELMKYPTIITKEPIVAPHIMIADAIKKHFEEE